MVLTGENEQGNDHRQPETDGDVLKTQELSLLHMQSDVLSMPVCISQVFIIQMYFLLYHDYKSKGKQTQFE